MPILTDAERLSTTIAGGKYTLDRVLGRGGMGTVFEGRHTWTGRRVAIKLLRHDMASNVEASRRYLQEARAATAIEHPNVVEVLDMGRDDEATVYLVFELLRGESLADRLDVVRQLSPMEAAMVLLPVADALASAHELGIIHRDIKPDNIFLENDGKGAIRPKLLDFGIARITDPAERGTRTGVVTGTPEYMSPEHAHGFRATATSDVWSLGVVLFECLTGTRPFEAETAVAVLMAIVSHPIPSLRECSYVPEPLAEFMEQVMVRDPAARLPDAAAFRDGLAKAVGIECVPARSRSVPPKLLTTSGEIEIPAERVPSPRPTTPSFDDLPIGLVHGDSVPPGTSVTPIPSERPKTSSASERTPTEDAIPTVLASSRARVRRRNIAFVTSAALLVVVGGAIVLSRPGEAATAADASRSAGASVGAVPSAAAAASPSSGAGSNPASSTADPASSGDAPAAVGGPVVPPSGDEATRQRSRSEASTRRRGASIGPDTARANEAEDDRRPRRSSRAARGANGSFILD